VKSSKHLMRVVFPAPFKPIKPYMQPAGTPKLTEQSADVLPKRLLTRLKSIASDMVPTELPTPADTA
jgi:hypothetical protein